MRNSHNGDITEPGHGMLLGKLINPGRIFTGIDWARHQCERMRRGRAFLLGHNRGGNQCLNGGLANSH